MRVLALSSSKAGNSEYLAPALPMIRDFLGPSSLKIAFIPFAGMTPGYTEYHSKVREALEHLNHEIFLVEHRGGKKIIGTADAVMVGGGNTFKLLHDLYETGLLSLIEKKVRKGMPYVGWSAGSNVCGPGIYTTNDMPIIEPKSFKSFEFFPFQLNPHYLNETVDGFHGETRDQRLEEFVRLNPGVPVVGIPEGTALIADGGNIIFRGAKAGIWLKYKRRTGMIERLDITDGDDILFLQKKK